MLHPTGPEPSYSSGSDGGESCDSLVCKFTFIVLLCMVLLLAEEAAVAKQNRLKAEETSSPAFEQSSPTVETSTHSDVHLDSHSHPHSAPCRKEVS